MRALPRRRVIMLTVGVGTLLTAFLRRDALGLAFFWDELGYYVPFSYTFFESSFHFHGGWIPPVSYKPPLLPLLTAAMTALLGWKLAVLRVITFVFGGLYLSGCFFLAREVLGKRHSFLCALALALSPVFLSQAGLAQPDLPMAALATWAFLALLRGQWLTGCALFALGVMANGTLMALAPIYVAVAVRRDGWMKGLFFPFPAGVLLLGWAGFALPFQKEAAELVRGGLAYNSIFLQGGLFVAKRLAHRIFQVGVSDFRWILSLGVLLAGIKAWRRSGSFRIPKALPLLGALVLLEIVFLSFFGVTHQRYFLVALPAFFVGGTWALVYAAGTRRWAAPSALILLALLETLAWKGAPGKYTGLEYRSEYAESIQVAMETASRLEELYPDRMVLTQWPLTEALSRPFLFYIRKPLAVFDLDRNQPEQEALLQRYPGKRAVLLWSESPGSEAAMKRATALLPEGSFTCNESPGRTQKFTLCLEKAAPPVRPL